MGVKLSHDICESIHQIHSQNPYIFLERVSTKSCPKNCEISNFELLTISFYFSLTCDHKGVNVSKDISSESTHEIH